MKKYLKLLLKFAVSFSLVYLVFKKVDIVQVQENLMNLNPGYIPLIFALFILNYFISSIRWKNLILKNSASVSVQYLTRLYFIGAFFNNFMPTSIGGDVYKVLVLGKRIESKTHAFVATFMERFTGILALLMISVVIFSVALQQFFFIPIVWFLLSIYTGIRVLSFLSKRVKFAEKIFSVIEEYKNHRRILVIAFLTSILVQIVALLTQYFIFRGLGAPVPWQYAFLVLPLITIAGFFIPSLNGLGVQDALYISLFGIIGIPQSVSLTASVLYHVFRLLISLVGGVFYVTEQTN